MCGRDECCREAKRSQRRKREKNNEVGVRNHTTPHHPASTWSPTPTEPLQLPLLLMLLLLPLLTFFLLAQSPPRQSMSSFFCRPYKLDCAASATHSSTIACLLPNYRRDEPADRGTEGVSVAKREVRKIAQLPLLPNPSCSPSLSDSVPPGETRTS